MPLTIGVKRTLFVVCFVLALSANLIFTGILYSANKSSVGENSSTSFNGEEFDEALKKLVLQLEEGINQSRGQKDERFKIAVLPCTFPMGIPSTRLGAYIRSTLSIRLIQGHQFIVLDRSILDKLITELEFQESDLIAPESRKKLGKFIGANAIVGTTIFDTGEYVKVACTLYDLTSASALAAADCRVDRSTIPSFLLIGSTTVNDGLSNRNRVQQHNNQNSQRESDSSHNIGFSDQILIPAKLETVNLTVLPVDANVEINGALIENELPGLYRIVRPAGSYALSVFRSGYRRNDSVLNLISKNLRPLNGTNTGKSSYKNYDKREVQDITIALKPEAGYFSVKLKEPDGTVYRGHYEILLNGKEIELGKNNQFLCKPGKYSILINTRTHYQVKKQVVVIDGAVQKVVISLKLKPVEPEPKSEFVNSLAMKMVYLPSGDLHMGSRRNEIGRMADEGPIHLVVLTKGFWIGKHEVTQWQYTQIMKGNKSLHEGRFKPVDRVSWDDAVEFCRRLSEKEGKTYRLPTEAEWEYACRGQFPQVFNEDLYKRAWYRHNSSGRSHNVGTKEANGWGLHDMLGNVKEWCSDFYGPYFSALRRDPKGTSYGRYRVLRGGSWFSAKSSCRTAYRADRADHPYSMVGFRVVCEHTND